MRRRFVARARDQAVRISELSAQLAGGAAGEDLFRELRQLSHSLHGAAGTFGFGEISDKAGAAEEALDAALKDPAIAAGKANDLQRQLGDVLAEIEKIS